MTVNPVELLDRYREVIRAGMQQHPRSLQKLIGPSEIGNPCDRAILRRLNGDVSPDRATGERWAAAIGTAVHAQLETWFKQESVTWLTEQRVTVGTLGTSPITGSSDLFHLPSGTVIDHKIVGAEALRNYRMKGPSKQYEIQAHLYARGFTESSTLPNAKHVAISFLLRNGNIRDGYFWCTDYDPEIATTALARLTQLYGLLQIAGVDRALASRPTLCTGPYCPWCRTSRYSSPHSTP